MNNSGQELWEKAKSIIPGGNQLLSKRSEMFLPKLWPSYYEKAKGCEIWDLDDNRFYDFAGMGISSCALGYADDDVDKAVINAVINGSMGTLNSYEEVQLAEKLLSLHPWSEMVRFSRTGGEACAIAIRIARAASGRDKIAFCGYHGWHDWYLASNLSDKSNLNAQLLPGLDPKGVPKSLLGTSVPFQYNDLDSFKSIIDSNKSEVGVIMMEPQRGVPPKKGFLETIRKVADEIGAVLIFDEVTSGFHNNLGGIHLTLGVKPDLAVFAKAMGNGFPISAIIGKREIMDVAQDTFISSTMWTERIGFTAGLATINKMQKNEVQKTLVEFGKKIKNGWMKISEASKVKIKISGLDSIPTFSFVNPDSLLISTYFTQEMMDKGFLAKTVVAATYAYNDKIIDDYLNQVNNVFHKIYKGNENKNIDTLLKGSIKHSTFTRLTG